MTSLNSLLILLILIKNRFFLYSRGANDILTLTGCIEEAETSKILPEFVFKRSTAAATISVLPLKSWRAWNFIFIMADNDTTTKLLPAKSRDQSRMIT